MTVVKPFQGVRYDLGKTGGDLGSLVAPPYDILPPVRQDALYNRHPNNFVRVDFNKPEPGDVPRTNDTYTRAAKFWNDWLREGILVRDGAPCFYLYQQTFTATVSGIDRRFRRTGLVAAVQAEEPGVGSIKPHEHTFAAPKEDRYRLTMATGVQLGQVFLLYDDPERRVEAATSAILTQEPWARFIDDESVEHAFWVVEDASLFPAIEQALADKTCIIADGHHRYETAHRVWSEVDPDGRRFHACLATLVNTCDPGLVVQPIPRIYQGCDSLSEEELERRLSTRFEIERLPFVSIDAIDAYLATMADTHHAFAVRWRESADYLVARAPRGSFGTFAPYSKDWSELDLAVLNRVIQEDLLGIDNATYSTGTRVVPIMESHLVMDYLDTGRDGQFAIVVNPTPVAAIERVTACGERMPQKSTFFHPKIWSGLVALPLDF